jgi:hypothetical protein
MFRPFVGSVVTGNGGVSTSPHTRSDLRIPFSGRWLQHVPAVLVKP